MIGGAIPIGRPDQKILSRVNMALIDIFRGIDLALQKKCEIDLAGAKSDEIVASAEKALGLKFPPSYKEFLLSFGCGDISGQEFYGVVNSDFVNSGIPDAVWLTIRERSDSQLPKRLVIVGAQGDGAYYALDCGRVGEDGECPVIIWWPGFSQEENIGDAEIVDCDFGTFFFK